VTTALDYRFVSRYRARVAPDMEENEIVHVYFGAAAHVLESNPTEVMDIRLLSAGNITEQLQTGGPNFASWFRHYMRNDQDKIRAAIALAMKPVPRQPSACRLPHRLPPSSGRPRSVVRPRYS
jgi:isopentenyldiphosphate isomerase